jgi:hypothetical protein
VCDLEKDGRKVHWVAFRENSTCWEYHWVSGKCKLMYMYRILTHEYHKRPVSYDVKQIPN